VGVQRTLGADARSRLARGGAAPIGAATPLPRRELHINDGAEVVAFVGRFVPPKNIPLLTEVLTQLLRQRPRALALICGDGPELPEFRAAMAGPRCRILGYRPDVWRLMKIADVIVSPSRHESRPNVVLEAAACGCPLALSRIAPHVECLPADAALWFSPDSPEEAAAAVARALDDRAAARARAERARRAVEGQSIEAMARAYERLYHGLLG
jgi:glycosyltransferase involved in cell wall biosynthesis